VASTPNYLAKIKVYWTLDVIGKGLHLKIWMQFGVIGILFHANILFDSPKLSTLSLSTMVGHCPLR